jgi:hypothetical protein
MREPREFDLDWEGRRCIVHELGALQARQVARRIANVVGTAVRESSKEGLDGDVVAAGGVAMGAILERLDDQTVEWLTQTFLKQTLVESEAGTEAWLSPKDVSELVFGGGDGLARWFRWMTFCLEMTCADFFAAAFSEFRRLAAKAKGPTTGAPSPTSTNGSASRSPHTSPNPGIFTGSP